MKLKTVRLIQDIQPAVTDWEKAYAHVEFVRQDILRVAAKNIEIDQVFVCMTCKKQNRYWRYLCESCDAKAQIEEDRYRDDS